MCAVVEIFFVNFGNCECAVEPGTLLFTTGPSPSFPSPSEAAEISHPFPALVVQDHAFTCEDGTVLHRFHHPLLRE